MIEHAYSKCVGHAVPPHSLVIICAVIQFLYAKFKVCSNLLAIETGLEALKDKSCHEETLALVTKRV